MACQRALLVVTFTYSSKSAIARGFCKGSSAAQNRHMSMLPAGTPWVGSFSERRAGSVVF